MRPISPNSTLPHRKMQQTAKMMCQAYDLTLVKFTVTCCCCCSGDSYTYCTPPGAISLPGLHIQNTLMRTKRSVVQSQDTGKFQIASRKPSQNAVTVHFVQYSLNSTGPKRTLGMRLSCNFVNVYTILYHVPVSYTHLTLPTILRV